MRAWRKWRPERRGGPVKGLVASRRPAPSNRRTGRWSPGGPRRDRARRLGLGKLVMDGIASRRWTGAADRFGPRRGLPAPALGEAAWRSTPDARDHPLANVAKRPALGPGKIVQTGRDFLSDNAGPTSLQMLACRPFQEVQVAHGTRSKRPGHRPGRPGPAFVGCWEHEFDQGLEMAPLEPQLRVHDRRARRPSAPTVDPRSAGAVPWT